MKIEHETAANLMNCLFVCLLIISMLLLYALIEFFFHSHEVVSTIMMSWKLFRF